MADIIETNPQTIASEVQADFASRLGEVLMPGDERRVFADASAYVLSVQNERAQLAFDALDPANCEGDILTARGEAVGVERSEGRPAKIFAAITTEQGAIVTIPAGTHISLGGAEWAVDAESVVYGHGDVAITATDNRPSAEGAHIQNSIPNTAEVQGTLLDDVEGVVSVTSASLPHLYTQRAMARDVDDDETYRLRVVEELSNPRSYTAQVRELMPDITDVRETNPQPGMVRLYVVYPGAGGYASAPTSAEQTALSEALQESERRYQGDMVSVAKQTALHPHLAVRVVCYRGTSAVVAARLPDVWREWCRSKVRHIIGEGIDVGDVVRVLDGVEHVHHIVVTAAKYSIGSTPRERPINGNPGYHAGSLDELVIWRPESLSCTFEEMP